MTSEFPENLVELVEEQAWIGPAAGQLQTAVSDAFAAGGETGRQIANFLNGTWLGHPVHPILTDVAIGSWTVAEAFDAVEALSGQDGISRYAEGAIALGLLGAAGAAIAGITDWQHLQGKPQRVGFMHAALNTTSALLFTASLVKRRQRRGGRLLSLLGYTISAAAAYLGGKLVYRYRVGVDHSAGQKLPADFVAVLPQGDLAENKPVRAVAEGVPVLLVRTGDRIHALLETCSHLGGPLSEGSLENGTIRCPWHGSRFSLEDGHVIDGPASHPQPCVEVRVRTGMIEVRGKDR